MVREMAMRLFGELLGRAVGGERQHMKQLARQGLLPLFLHFGDPHPGAAQVQGTVAGHAAAPVGSPGSCGGGGGGGVLAWPQCHRPSPCSFPGRPGSPRGRCKAPQLEAAPEAGRDSADVAHWRVPGKEAWPCQTCPGGAGPCPGSASTSPGRASPCPSSASIFPGRASPYPIGASSCPRGACASPGGPAPVPVVPAPVRSVPAPFPAVTARVPVVPVPVPWRLPTPVLERGTGVPGRGTGPVLPTPVPGVPAAAGGRAGSQRVCEAQLLLPGASSGPPARAGRALHR